MFYEHILEIPKNTSQDAPVTYDLAIHPGTIQQVEVYFPPGCAALVHIQIYLWGHQIYPTNPDSFFSGDDQQITFQDDLLVTDPPYTLHLAGWNEDDTYPHSPIIRVQVTPTGQTLQEYLQFLRVGPTGPVSMSGG